jgi:hypothetical protein
MKKLTENLLLPRGTQIWYFHPNDKHLASRLLQNKLSGELGAKTTHKGGMSLQNAVSTPSL